MMVDEQRFNMFVDDVLAHTAEVERQLVVAGWFSPTALFNAGHQHKLTGDHFSDWVAGYLYCYVCTCAGLGRTPSVDEAADVAGRFQVDRTPVEFLDLLCQTVYTSDDIDQYAADVAYLAARRKEAHEHFRRYVELAVGERYDVDVRPKATAKPCLRGEVV